jgi:integrase
MPRPSNWPPKIQVLKSGQARVCFKGKTYYLGAAGSPEAQAAYARLLVELSTGSPSATTTGSTVGEVLTQYQAWLRDQPDSSTIRKLRNVASAMMRLFADVPVQAFTVRHLETLRSSWTNGIGCERQSNPVANTNTSRTREILRWAEIRGLAPEGLYGRLVALPPLKGVAKAVEPVEWSTVQATLPYLEPGAASICLLCWWTGMRPKEVCSLTAESIDLPGGWLTLETHKTSAKTGTHRLPIGPQAAAILSPILAIRPTGYLFPSTEAGHFQPISLARAVHRVCFRHGIARWTPYQLRHAAKERIAQELGLEAARIILRHTSLGMTARYASRIDLNFAAEIAKKCG